MSQDENSHQFEDILNACCELNSSRWETGWRHFLKRYKRFLYHQAALNCKRWNVPRLRMQFSDAVEDIVSEVLITLCRNRCQALVDFRARESENMFLSWLATICRRVSSRFIFRNFKDIFSEGDLETISQFTGALSFENRWELYQHSVHVFRTGASQKKKQLERDIHLFQLYVWADFSVQTIHSLPCFQDLGHRVIDNISSRLKDFIRNSGIP